MKNNNRKPRFSIEFYLDFKGTLMPTLFKLFSKTETEATLSNSFIRPVTVIYPNHMKKKLYINHILKKKQQKRNCRTISPINIYAKILNKIFANKT